VTLVHAPVVVRVGEAEHLVAPGAAIQLLVDGPATGGRISTHRLRLDVGTTGASPHHHHEGTEAFFVLDGMLQVLIGTEIVELLPGDFAAVPPEVVHAFGSGANAPADVLILVTPGVERFPFFRDLMAVRDGRQPAPDLAGTGERYDQAADDSEAWALAHADPVEAAMR
jgi:quercetin dioxygenase-like cupin family protein